MSAARFGLEVLSAWLMPWRAARRIRDLDEALSATVRALGYLTAGQQRGAGRACLYRIK